MRCVLNLSFLVRKVVYRVDGVLLMSKTELSAIEPYIKDQRLLVLTFGMINVILMTSIVQQY